MSDEPEDGGAAERPGCPRCGAPLVPGAPRCAACGLRVVGRDAADLWALDEWLLVLQGRRAELLASLAADDVAASSPSTTPAAGGSPSPTVLAYGGPYTGTAHRPGPGGGTATAARRLGAQQLLLVTGVVLVAVAAIAFTAYAWSAIGVLGQAAVLLSVCAGAAAGSRAAAARHLTASSEALAVLAVVVLVVLLSAARALDVLGLGSTDGDAYRLGALLVVVGAAAAGDRWLRRGEHPRALAWAAVLLTGLVPSALTAAVRGQLLTWSAGALVLAVLSVVATRPLDRRSPVLGAAGLVMGAAHLGAAVLALLLVAVDAGPGAWEPFAAAAQLLLLAGAAARLAVRSRPAPDTGGHAPGPLTARGRGLLGGRPGVQRTAVVVAHAGVVGAVFSLAAAGGSSAVLLLGLAVSTAVAAILAVRPGLLPWPALVAAVVLAGGSLLAEPAVGATEGTWWRPAAWYALAVAAALAGLRRPWSGTAPLGWHGLGLRDPASPVLGLSRSLWAAAASSAVLGAAVLAPPPVGAVVSVLLALVASTLLLAASAAVRGPTEPVLAAGWAVTALTCAATASEGPVPVAVVLGVAGLAALLRAGERSRTGWVVPGAALLACAWWSEVDDLAPPGAGVEWWSLPPALLALALGVLVWQRHPQLGSWAALGPGLAGGLLPSAVQGAGEGLLLTGGWRVAVVAVVGAAACAVGVRAGWQAPVVLGAAAALLVAVGQLGVYVLMLPVSVGLFAAGAVVIVLAVRIEKTRRDARRALGWVRALR